MSFTKLFKGIFQKMFPSNFEIWQMGFLKEFNNKNVQGSFERI